MNAVGKNDFLDCNLLSFYTTVEYRHLFFDNGDLTGCDITVGLDGNNEIYFR